MTKTVSFDKFARGIKGSLRNSPCSVGKGEQSLRRRDKDPLQHRFVLDRGGRSRDPTAEVLPIYGMDHLLMAIHRHAAPFIMPYSLHREEVSWWYSHVIMNVAAALLFGPHHVLQFNGVNAQTHRAGYVGYPHECDFDSALRWILPAFRDADLLSAALHVHEHNCPTPKPFNALPRRGPPVAAIIAKPGSDTYPPTHAAGGTDPRSFLKGEQPSGNTSSGSSVTRRRGNKGWPTRRAMAAAAAAAGGPYGKMACGALVGLRHPFWHPVRAAACGWLPRASADADTEGSLDGDDGMGSQRADGPDDEYDGSSDGGALEPGVKQGSGDRGGGGLVADEHLGTLILELLQAGERREGAVCAWCLMHPRSSEASLCANRLPGLELLEARRGVGGGGGGLHYDAEQRRRLSLDERGNRVGLPRVEVMS